MCLRIISAQTLAVVELLLSFQCSLFLLSLSLYYCHERLMVLATARNVDHNEVMSQAQKGWW
jgi:hypothetical protein